MKLRNRSNRQSGFFDLGMSLFVIAIAGGVIYGAESPDAEKIAASRTVEVAEQTLRPAAPEASVDRTGDASVALK